MAQNTTNQQSFSTAEQMKIDDMMKPSFRPDLPVPDTVWSIALAVGVFGIVGNLLRLCLSYDYAEPNAAKWLYLFWAVGLVALSAYARRKAKESIARRYAGVNSMPHEQKKKLVEEQVEYFQYQLRVALLLGFWGTLIPALMFYFFNAVGLHSLGFAFIFPLTFCWPLIIWRIVLSLRCLSALKQTQEPV